MADQRSIEMLAFNFASRTFAYRRLAQGLSRAISAFSSFMREYLDLVIKADLCAQIVDDVGIAANDANHLIANLRATFEYIREAGVKLSMHKSHFGTTAIDFLGRTITPEGVKPQKERVTNFLEKTKFPRVQESLTALSRFSQLLQELYTKIIRDISPIFSIAQKGREGPGNHRVS